MLTLSKKTLAQPSMTVSLNSLAASKKRKGEQVYNFAAGEPHLLSHPAIAAAIEAGMRRPVLYAPLKGLEALRQEAAEWMNRTYGTRYPLDQTIVTTGGKFALYAALQAVIDEQEEVLIPAPYWVSYPEMVKLCGGVPIPIPSRPEQGWKITPEEIRAYCTEKTKALLLNSSCNPTGIVYTREELQKILETVQELGLFLLSDEVYSELVYTGSFTSCGSFPEFADSTVVIQSCSKNFAMTGWRVGFAFAPVRLVEAIALFQGHMTTGTSTVSQWAALAALQHAEEISSSIRSEMRQRRDLCCHLLERLFDTRVAAPEGSVYLFLSLDQLRAPEQSAVDYCMRVLKKNNVVLVPGDAFGKERYVRLAFSADLPEIEQGLLAWKQGEN
jgi:aspartate/methionine/tyrosine aminotransferase